MQFAVVTFFLFTSTLTSGWARSVDLQLTEPQTPSLHMMDNMCTDCKKTVQLLTEILSSQDSQHLIEKSLDKFCYEHPVIPLCMNGAKTYVHLVIRYFSAFASQNGDICSMMGLCGSQSERKAPSELTVSLNEQGSLYAKASRGTSQEVQVNPLCNFCMLIIKTIESMLPKERTEEAIVNLLEKICDYLPSQYKDTCNNFVETYGKQLIDLLLSSLPPHAICTALGLCLFPETPLLLSSEQTDCDSCKILAILSQLHLGHNATEIQTSDLLQKMCHLHPNAIPRCEGFVKLHGHRLLKSDGKQAPITACEEDYLCRGPK
ncbi:prosaposin-like [Sinocyclocheilus anshuiensis]|uniref:Pulmonary surfactant-associated protein B n=1 Tax=Sinocyclocheilus anshuiensis TaxID=1608454 RepID=A0A671KSE0_9TELE|nr:PREDICTED: prosaposin-like [Sinocyclocheilus anshuiensis]